MLSLSLFVVIALVLAAGFAIKFFLDKTGNELSITNMEYAIGAVICCIIVVPLTLMVGTHMAKASAVGGFKEYWGGYETKAYQTTDRCFKYRDQDTGDGCAHHYVCGSYTVTIHHDATYDSNGNETSAAYDTYEQHDIFCPETTEEENYLVDTTLGTYTIAAGLLPLHPYKYEWDHDGNIPASALADSYVPKFWIAAKARLAAGNPGAVTAMKSYKNFILASQSTILKKYSSSIDSFLKLGLLPKVTTKIDFPYLGTKAYFVGKAPANATAWNDSVNRFNGALGSTRQGDLHFIIVTDPRVSNPDEWFNALQAYWQSKKLGKHAISKNALIVAVGSKDGKTVSWARAATGMPVGNEQLFPEITSALEGQAFNPATLIGYPVGKLYNKDGKTKVKIQLGNGLLERTVFGPNGFQRVCMICKTKGDKGVGYGYLSGEIQPSGGAKFLIGFLAFLFSMFVWGAFVAIGVRPGSPLRNRSTY
jgi:hypothetical protein